MSDTIALNWQTRPHSPHAEHFSASTWGTGTPTDSVCSISGLRKRFLMRTGKLKVDPAKRIKEPVTLQDSCNYIRNQGLKEITREIMSYIVEPGYFIDMDPSGEHNYCCGGGGGFNGIGLFRPQRNEALKTKRDQILATGAKLVIAPCHNCWDAIRDLEEEFSIGIRWSFLKPLLIKMVEVPDHLKPTD